jgi:hypothetical protein
VGYRAAEDTTPYREAGEKDERNNDCETNDARAIHRADPRDMYLMPMPRLGRRINNGQDSRIFGTASATDKIRIETAVLEICDGILNLNPPLIYGRWR